MSLGSIEQTMIDNTVMISWAEISGRQTTEVCMLAGINGRLTTQVVKDNHLYGSHFAISPHILA